MNYKKRWWWWITRQIKHKKLLFLNHECILCTCIKFSPVNNFVAYFYKIVNWTTVFICIRIGPLTVAEQCLMDSNALIPHPTECQAYYNCSMRYETVPRLFEQHLMECSYPEYFNPDTKRCDHFENVKCGVRQAFKNACKWQHWNFILAVIECLILKLIRKQ